MVRSIMGFANLSISFWGYSLETACYVLNNVPSKIVTKTPYEIWTGCRLTLSHLRILGCSIYVKYLSTDKLGPRSDKYYFVRYPKELKDIISTLLKNKNYSSVIRQFFWKKSFLMKKLIPLRLNLIKFDR